MIPYIETHQNFIFTKADGTPQQVSVEHPNYDEIVELVKSSEQEVLTCEQETLLEELVSPAAKLQTIFDSEGFSLTADKSTGTIVFSFNGGTLDVPADLADYILGIDEKGESLAPLVAFLSKLAMNPDKEVFDQLWDFITVCGLSLTEDGDFLAYKNVRDDFTSIFDGKTDNQPGTVVAMPRMSVEKNPHRTCSSGLHFAAWGYLQHYSMGQKTVLVKISPEDVVSIPSDYNFQKGRACRYQILREVRQPEELKNIDIMYEEDYD